MNIKRYIVVHDLNQLEMVVEIDSDILTEAAMHEINNFWGGEEWRLEQEGGNITDAVLKLLAAEVFNTASYCWDVADTFDSKEGWPKMDGSQGIRLVSYDEPSYDAYDMTVTEM